MLESRIEKNTDQIQLLKENDLKLSSSIELVGQKIDFINNQLKADVQSLRTTTGILQKKYEEINNKISSDFVSKETNKKWINFFSRNYTRIAITMFVLFYFLKEEHLLKFLNL